MEPTEQRKPLALNSAHAALVTAAALFAAGYPLARAVDPAAGMDMMVTQGMLFGAITLELLGRRGGKLRKKHLWPVIINGAGSAVTCIMIMEGAKVISPSLAAVIVISNALMVAVMTWFMGRKRFSAPQAAALAAGFLGVVWISLERGVFAGEAVGVILLTISAALIAIMTVVIERPVMEAGGAVITRWSFWIAFITSLAIVLLTGRLKFHSMEQTGLALFFGTVCAGAPALMFNGGMGRIGAADAAAFKLLIPVFAFVYGVAFMGEIPNLGSVAAGLLVIGSLGVYQFSHPAKAGG